MLRTYRICNSNVGFSKYEFYNKLLGGVTLFYIFILVHLFCKYITSEQPNIQYHIAQSYSNLIKFSFNLIGILLQHNTHDVFLNFIQHTLMSLSNDSHPFKSFYRYELLIQYVSKIVALQYLLTIKCYFPFCFCFYFN